MHALFTVGLEHRWESNASTDLTRGGAQAVMKAKKNRCKYRWRSVHSPTCCSPPAVWPGSWHAKDRNQDSCLGRTCPRSLSQPESNLDWSLKLLFCQVLPFCLHEWVGEWGWCLQDTWVPQVLLTLLPSNPHLSFRGHVSSVLQAEQTQRQ